MRGFGDGTSKKNKSKNVKEVFNDANKNQIYIKATENHLKGNIEEAKKYYQIFLDNGFIDHRVFLNYGMIFHQLSNFKKAEEFYLNSINLVSDNPIAYFNLGNIFVEKRIS